MVVSTEDIHEAEEQLASLREAVVPKTNTPGPHIVNAGALAVVDILDNVMKRLRVLEGNAGHGKRTTKQAQDTDN